MQNLKNIFQKRFLIFKLPKKLKLASLKDLENINQFVIRTNHNEELILENQILIQTKELILNYCYKIIALFSSSLPI